MSTALEALVRRHWMAVVHSKAHKEPILRQSSSASGSVNIRGRLLAGLYDTGNETVLFLSAMEMTGSTADSS